MTEDEAWRALSRAAYECDAAAALAAYRRYLEARAERLKAEGIKS